MKKQDKSTIKKQSRKMTEQKDLIAAYNPRALQEQSNSRPVIGICFDWRFNSEKKCFEYPKWLYTMYCSQIERAGGLPYILKFSDRANPNYSHILDGCVIPGGRDLDPASYNQSNEEGHSIFDVTNSKQRLEHCKDLFFNSQQSMPIFGICYGLQVLNVCMGGSLNQHIHNHEEHTSKLRKVNLKKMNPPSPSLIQGHFEQCLINDKSIGMCYHHQGVDRLGDNLRVAVVDDEDGSIHGIEHCSPERTIFAILYHPEISKKILKKMVGQGFDDTSNIQMFDYLVKKSIQYRNSKKNATQSQRL